MGHTSRTFYFVMAAWLLVGGMIRIVLFLGQGRPVDALPIISIAIGVIGLGLAFRPHRQPPAGSE